MRTVYIDCYGAKSAAEVWQRYVDAAAPDGAAGFGRNLDAFWDAIEHGGPGWPRNTKLVFKNSSELATIRVGTGSSFLDELRHIANEATQTQIQLT